MKKNLAIISILAAMFLLGACAQVEDPAVSQGSPEVDAVSDRKVGDDDSPEKPRNEAQRLSKEASLMQQAIEKKDKNFCKDIEDEASQKRCGDRVDELTRSD